MGNKIIPLSSPDTDIENKVGLPTENIYEAEREYVHVKPEKIRRQRI
jgi:hypothetical protein